MRRAIGRMELSRQLAGWNEAGVGAAYERLAGAVRAAVLDGRLPVGGRLPAERDLAAELHLSRTTVSAAYRRLRETGFLVSRQGSGSHTALPAGRSRGLGAIGPAFTDDADYIDLAIAATEPDVDALREAMAEAQEEALASLSKSGGHGYYLLGVPAFRQAIADRHTARGTPTDPDQILVTAGAQGAIDLVARCFLEPRDVVLVESPTYPNAIDAFKNHGARLTAVPVSDDHELFVSTFRALRPRLAYLTPDFHNPTASLLGAHARAEVVRVARETCTLLVVDETMAELPLDGQPMPPPVSAFDPDGRVVTIGSMAKSFWGGLRLGWVRATPAVVDELAAARASVDLASPMFEQFIARALISRSDELLPPRRHMLAEQRDTLLKLLAELFPGWRWQRPAGGLCVWVRIDAPVSTVLTEAAERHGVRLASGPRFGLDGAFESYLRLPFTLPGPDMAEAVTRIAAAYEEVRAGRPASRRTSVIA